MHDEIYVYFKFSGIILFIIYEDKIKGVRLLHQLLINKLKKYIINRLVIYNIIFGHSKEEIKYEIRFHIIDGELLSK